MNEKERLVEALDYAIEHQTFNKAVAVQRAKNVCCFGLGTYLKMDIEGAEIAALEGATKLLRQKNRHWRYVYTTGPVISGKYLT